jgi:hypothetical protein
MFKRFTIIVLLPVSLVACAQSKTVIKKVHSFYTERMPGNIRADQNGEPLEMKPDTAFIVYVELSSKLITWDSAWKNDRVYLIIAQLISPTPFDAGTTKMDNRKIIIAPAKGNYLWQLYLQPLKELRTAPQTLKESEILLKGKFKRRSILQKAENPVALQTIPSV